MSEETGRPVDVLAWQEILYRVQVLENKVFNLQDDLAELRREASKQPKVLTWRDVP